MAEPVDYAWAAGIIDGEGCIGLYRHKARSAGGRDSYLLRVGVGNTEPAMLLRMKEIFGCGFLKSKRVRAAWRPAWEWITSTRDAERVLRAVLPYLVNKREQAEIALASRALVAKHGSLRHNPNQEELKRVSQRLQDMKREIRTMPNVAA